MVIECGVAVRKHYPGLRGCRVPAERVAGVIVESDPTVGWLPSQHPHIILLTSVFGLGPARGHVASASVATQAKKYPQNNNATNSHPQQLGNHMC